MRKIVFTGPESTGKTTTTTLVANYYACDWVRENARSYLEEINRPYKEADLLEIAKRQVEEETLVAREYQPYLFCDTSLLVLKIWSEYRYKRCHPWIIAQLHERRPDLYFLCAIDVPWEKDPFREHPSSIDRIKLFELYKKELTLLKVPYIVLKGGVEQRFEKVKKILSVYTSTF